MAINMKKAMAGLLNEGGSIFGELSEGVKKIEDFKKEVEKNPEQVYILNSFEVRSKTKKHGSPYVTFGLDGELVSGYATAIGNKLMKLAKEFGKVDGNHYYFKDNAELEVQFSVGKSEAGEYLDMVAVIEE